MPIFELEVGGRKIEIDAPDMQTALSSVGAAQPQAAPDPYKQDARAEYEKLKALGVPVEPSLSRRLAHGLLMGGSDEVLAAAKTPLEMWRRGTMDPVEGYRSAKAWEDTVLEEARKNQGVAGHVAEVAGGVGTGIGAARAGLTLVRSGASLPARVGALSAEGAAYGGAQGFLDAPDGERLSNAGTGAAIGAGVGAALPAVGAVGGAVLGPIASNIRARVNPSGVAASQVARAVDESGRPVADIAQDVTRAASEGQGVFTVADALGSSGQRMLSGVARSPGEGRTQAVEFLDRRQAGQSRRVANMLAEGFESPQTAEQTQAALTAQRTADAATNYGAARTQAGPVNVTPAVEAIDATLQPGVSRILNPQTGIADNSIEGALRRARSYLTDGRSQVSDFNGALMAKREIDAMIETASPTVQRALIPVRNALDDQLAAASEPYRAARDQFRRQSQAIESVDHGRTAAMRGRTEDTVPAFQAMRPDQQQAYRSGFVDPLIAQTQGAAHGTNAARPFTSDAFRTEAAAMAPGNTLMQRRLDREMTMHQTRQHATGNSRTFDNFQDADALRVDPSLLASIFSGDLGGAARRGLGSVSNALHGSTPSVRTELARLLLQRGPATTIERDVGEVLSSTQTRRELGSALARALLSGSAVASERVKNRKQEQAKSELVNLLLNQSR